MAENAAQKTATGCRPDALFGVWSIDPAVLEGLVRAAEGVDLAQARAMAAAAPEPEPYRMLAGGIAEISIVGAMTKYPNSMQSVLGGTSSLMTRDAVRKAARDPEVKGIYVKVDSPGGTVAGTGDLAEAIASATRIKPVHARVEDKAASAALHSIAGATRITANASAWVGSVGAYAVLKDSSAQAEASGVRYRVISSGGVKGTLVDGLPISDEAAADVQRIVDEMTEQFVSFLAKGRKLPISRARELADGRMHAAKAAQSLGLIDAVETDDQALRALIRETMKMSDTDTTAALALAEEQQAKANTLAAENVKLKAELDELKAKASAPPADPLAALPPEARAVVEAQAKELADAKAKVTELETKSRDERFLAEAKALGLPNDAAKVLASIEQAAGAEAYAGLRTHISGLRAQVKESEIFGEKGTTATGSAASLEDLAEQAVKAGKFKTKTDALVSLAEQHPDLYAAHARGEKG